MKVFKCFSAVSFIGAILMTGCTYSEIQPEVESSQILQINQITAYNGDSGTKTVLADDKTSILWKPNDKINVFYGSASVEFTSMNTEPEECTIFTSSSSIVYGGTESSSSYIWAVYPYSSNNTHDKTSVTLTVPSSIAGVPDSFANGSYPAIGRSKDTNIAFYNVCGGICFTVTTPSVNKVIITGNNNEDIAGTVKVGFDENERPIMTEVTSGQKSITITAGLYDSYSFQVGKRYYIPMLPVNLTNGFTMQFYKAYSYSGTESAILVSNSPYEVRRSIFGQVENADNNLTYRVRVNSLSFKSSTAYVEPQSSVQLTYTMSPSAATYDSIAWSSSNENIATVDQDGVVTGVSNGTCTITLTLDDVSASCTVYVSSPSSTTGDATNISYGSAVLNGSMSAPGIDDYSPTMLFLYSKTSNTVEDLIASHSTIGASSADGQNFSASITELEPNTTYYYIAACRFYDYYSSNHYYNYYGLVKSFTTNTIPTLPEGVVDLGLSVKWASTNLGADLPEELGDLYAWGEVSTKQNYNVSNYKWWDYRYWESDDDCGSYLSVTKYGSSSTDWGDDEVWVDDGKTVLDAEDDVAKVEWRGKWRMPTQTECQELIDNCSFELVIYNGQRGYLVTSNKTGYSNKRIFLPELSGSFSYFYKNSAYDGYTWRGVYGVCFWSASQFLPYPIGAYAYTRNGLIPVYRAQGLPIRPVNANN